MRNYDDPLYIAWREAVRARDGNACKWCGSTEYLNCHHIKTWGGHPELRFAVNNGITLCWRCHRKVKGKERQYEAMFLGMIGKHSGLNIRMQMRRRKDAE